MKPDDEQARIKERERGLLARQIFDNPLWGEAYDALADDILSRMVSTATDDEETLECKRRLLALHAVKTSLHTIMQTGMLAAKQLDEAQHGKRQRVG